MVQSLLMYFFLYYNSNKGKHWNSPEIWAFQWIPMETNPRGSWIPSDSIGNSMEWKTKMAEVPAKWILSEFHGILTFRLESSGFRRNSWGRVKTSINTTSFFFARSIYTNIHFCILTLLHTILIYTSAHLSLLLFSYLHHPEHLHLNPSFPPHLHLISSSPVCG